MYKQRWTIENLFGNMKTKGFYLEKTHNLLIKTKNYIMKVKAKVSKLISISPEVNRELTKLSIKIGKPVTELIREAIKQYILSAK